MQNIITVKYVNWFFEYERIGDFEFGVLEKERMKQTCP